MNENIDKAREAAATIAQALARPKPLSADECRGLIQLLLNVRTAVEVRYEAIKPAKNDRGFAGPERVRMMATAGLDELVALNAEFELVNALRDQLGAQLELLQSRIRAADFEEKERNLPGLQDELAAKVAEAEAARVAFMRALDSLDSAYDEVCIARAIVKRAGGSAAGAKVETLRSIVQLSQATNFSSRRRRALMQEPQDLGESLGVEQTARQEVERAA